MKKIIVALILWVGFAFGAFALDQQTTTVGINNQTGAYSGAVGNGGAVTFAPTTNTKVQSQVFMPNSGPSPTPNPTNFTKSPGLAELTNGYSKLFAELSRANIPNADVLDSPRAQTDFTKTDFAIMTFQPARDLFMNVPSEKESKTAIAPIVTNISEYFGNMPQETTHYILGYVAVRTLFDEEKQDVTLQETLLAEGMRFAVKDNRFAGFAEVVPVVIYETNAYYHGTAVSGSGINVSPQVSGVTAIGVATGGLFNWGKNHGLAVESNGLGMKIIFLAKAPNPAEGHHIALEVQNINDAVIKADQEKAKTEEEKNNQQKEQMYYLHGGEKG